MTRWDERALAHLRERALVPRGAEMAARRPLDEVIKATLAAAGRSAHTRRSYLTAIGQFLSEVAIGRGDDSRGNGDCRRRYQRTDFTIL